MSKNVQNYHTNALISQASKVILKILQARLQQYMNWEPPDVQAGFRKGRETCQHLLGHRKSKRKALTVWITTNWKIFKKMGIPDHLTCLLRNLYIDQEAAVRTNMEQWTGSKSGKEYVKAVYCHLAYLTYMQSTACEMPGWIKHKLKSRLPGESWESISSGMQMTPPLWQKVKRN